MSKQGAPQRPPPPSPPSPPQKKSSGLPKVNLESYQTPLHDLVTNQPPAYSYPPNGTLMGNEGFYGDISYRIRHVHDSHKALLTVHLQPGSSFHACPNSLFGMTPNVNLKPRKTGFTRLFSSKVQTEVFRVGMDPVVGEITLAPHAIGDIVCMFLHGSYIIHHHALLAFTDGLECDWIPMSSNLIGSSSSLVKVEGTGLLFLSPLGGVQVLDLQPGQQYILEHGHLVAWSPVLKMQIISFSSTGFNAVEGFGCMFTGPGKVYTQTVNPRLLAKLLEVYLPRG